MKTRNQIEEKYKWDLTKFCKNDKQWYEMVEQLKQLVPQFSQFRGKLNQPEQLLKLYELEEKFYYISSKCSMYCSNNRNTDLSNSTYVEMENMLVGIEAKAGEETAYIAPEMLSYSEDYLKELIADPRFQSHAFGLQNLLRNKAHILSEPEEKLLSGSGVFAGEFSNIFHSLVDANMHFHSVANSKGKMLPLTLSNYSTYLNSTDRTLRKNAFLEIYKQFETFADTLSSNYIASLKADWFYAKSSKFESVLNQHLYPDNIPNSVYDQLVKNVNNHLPLLHDYYKQKAKLLGLTDFSYYDLYVSPAKLKNKVGFEQAINLLLTALKPLGDDYLELIKRSVSERWIDVYPNKNKRSGAYQSDAYGCTPIVLLNYEGLTDDVFTCAHELGHAMHSYYSNKNQPITTAGYTIFLAEVASTVNEVLLLKHLYHESKTKQEKLYYLDHYLQMFKGTIFRQTMFSEFEHYAHQIVEKNEPISKNVLNNYNEMLNKKYQGKAVKHQREINYEWLRIPHFYTPYYVYKYATGLISAICIASNIYNQKPQAVENYKQFLSAGGSNFSMEILKIAGVNLQTEEPYNIAFSEMKWAVNELKKLK